MIRVRLLGRFQIVRDDRLVAFSTAKAKELAALLSWRYEDWIQREECRGALWPDKRESLAAGSLRQTLYRLRSSLAAAGCDEILQTCQAALRLRLDESVRIDVRDYIEAASSAHSIPQRLSNSDLALLDSMDELLTDIDAPWATVARHEFGRLRIDGLRQAIAMSDAIDGVDAGIAHAERWVELEPLNERVHQTLIRLYLARGDHGSAMRQYARCREVLGTELGICPAPETTRLIDSVVQKSD